VDLVNVDLLIKDGLIVTVDAQRRVISSGAVAIAEGRIVDVGKTDEIARRYSADEVLDATDFIVLPGLIDSHVHISAEHLTRGIVTDDAGPEWLGKWGLPLYAALTPEDEYLGAKLSCLEMIRNGTTTFGEGGTVRDMAATVQAIDEARLRAVLAPWISDSSSGSLLLSLETESALALTEDLIVKFNGAAGGRVQMAASFVTASACSHELLQGLMEIADRNGVTFHYHHGSTRESVEAYVSRHGRRPLLDFADLGVLAPNVRTTHMVHLNDDEVQVLAESGASVAHCPQTALKLGYGATAVGKFPEMLAAGVPVTLGTDGANTSDNLDLFKVMQLAAGLFKDARENASLIPAESALEMATIRGAHALGLEDELGSLDTGKRADLILISRHAPEFNPLIDVVNALVYGSDGRNVDTVIVDGKVIMQAKEVLTLDAEKLYAEVAKASPKLIARAGLKPQPRWPIH